MLLGSADKGQSLPPLNGWGGVQVDKLLILYISRKTTSFPNAIIESLGEH